MFDYKGPTSAPLRYAQPQSVRQSIVQYVLSVARLTLVSFTTEQGWTSNTENIGRAAARREKKTSRSCEVGDFRERALSQALTRLGESGLASSRGYLKFPRGSSPSYFTANDERYQKYQHLIGRE